MKPIRLGVMAENAQTPTELLDTARRAEAAGCSTLLIRDHLVEGPFRHQLAPLTALAAVAAATTRLRVGTLVICNDFRHPAVLAKAAATLDVLSGGRLELGLGAGFLRREYDEAGLRFDPPGDRVGRLEESLQVLKGLFGPGPFTYEGRHYRFSGLDSYPSPVQRPHPPLHVAAAQPRMLAIAGREADIVNLQGVATTGGVMREDPAGRSPEATAERIERVRAAAGARADQVEISMTIAPIVTDRPREAAEELARARGWGISGDQVLAMPSVLAGPPDRLVELLNERRERFGVSYFIASDADLAVVEELATVGAR
ncbi:MAG TPA: TIGR03621 family F420-dependent LLM class oxidoreductase [Candidatus Dormibacteraeota bacterium]|nr:TIGR03621 family F420-dependent LLM class oxidoreductase [Candidatus Dormibacteraeota bacterium]